MANSFVKHTLTKHWLLICVLNTGLAKTHGTHISISNIKHTLTKHSYIELNLAKLLICLLTYLSNIVLQTMCAALAA